MAAYSQIEAIEFTRREEGVVGADCLWWWLDRNGECYGMLVQAKKLHRRVDGWFIDTSERGSPARAPVAALGLPQETGRDGGAVGANRSARRGPSGHRGPWLLPSG